MPDGDETMTKDMTKDMTPSPFFFVFVFLFFTYVRIKLATENCSVAVLIASMFPTRSHLLSTPVHHYSANRSAKKVKELTLFLPRGRSVTSLTDRFPLNTYVTLYDVLLEFQ